jgi:hypothetical protein
MAYKVIQWATGPVGRAALHHTIRHPDLELVGVWVHSDSKVGVDAGDLVGLPKTGVLATTDKNAILGLDADCVIYTPKLFLDPAAMDQEVTTILRSGKNVLTTAGYWHPYLHGEDYVNQLEDACRAGGVSLFGSGENPGYFFERMAVSATGLCDTLDEVRLYEYVDCAVHPSPTLVFDVVGFGKDPQELEQGSALAAMLDRCYPETLALCARMMKIDYDTIERESTFRRAERDLTIASGTVPKGGVSVGQPATEELSRNRCQPPRRDHGDGHRARHSGGGGCRAGHRVSEQTLCLIHRPLCHPHLGQQGSRTRLVGHSPAGDQAEL